MRRKAGWKGQTVRHSNAKKYGHAGGKYATSKPPKRFKKTVMGYDVNNQFDKEMALDVPSSQLNAEGKKEKKLMSDRAKQNKFYEDYVIDSISSEGYDEQPKTKKEKLQFLYDTFKDEYWNNNPSVQRLGETKAFEEWIKGLPSSYNIEFSNYDILKLAKRSGSLPENATEKQEDRVLENYWNFISVKTFQAFKKYDVK